MMVLVTGNGESMGLERDVLTLPAISFGDNRIAYYHRLGSPAGRPVPSLSLPFSPVSGILRRPRDLRNRHRQRRSDVVTGPCGKDKQPTSGRWIFRAFEDNSVSASGPNGTRRVLHEAHKDLPHTHTKKGNGTPGRCPERIADERCYSAFGGS